MVKPCQISKLLLEFQSELGDNQDASSCVALTDLLNRFAKVLDSPTPFHVKSKSTDDRQSIVSGKVDKFPSLPQLTDEQKLGIFSMSDRYDLNEIICLEYWIAASDADVRRWLEQQFDNPTHYYDNQVAKTAFILFEYDQTNLLELINVLFKSRHDIELLPNKRQIITAFTNKLLEKSNNDGDTAGMNIIANLLVGFKKGLEKRQEIVNFKDLTNDSIQVKAFIRELLKILAENILIATYHVQLVESEYLEILDLIKSLSEKLSTDSVLRNSLSSDSVAIDFSSSSYTKSATISSHSPVSSDNLISGDDCDLFNLLMLLQLTQISVVSQTEVLHHRESQKSITASLAIAAGINLPFAGPNTAVGNTLLQAPEPHVEQDDSWLGSKGVKGLTCLLHAVLRQPLVDADSENSSDVVRFMSQASVLRGYSYLRVCILPVLQSRYIGSLDIQPLLIDIVGGFLSNVVAMLDISIYRFQPESGYPFFPDEPFQVEVNENGKEEVVGLCDSFEDFLLLLCDFMRAMPKFANIFWRASPKTIDDLPNQLEFQPIDSDIELSLEECAFDGDNFLNFVTAAGNHHSSLLPTAWRFFACLCGSNGESSHIVSTFLQLTWTSSAIGFGVEDSYNFKWSFFLNAVSNIVTNLTMTPNAASIPSRNIYSSSQTSSAVRVVQLTDHDEDSLLAILEFVSCLLQSPVVVKDLLRLPQFTTVSTQGRSGLEQVLEVVSSLIPCPNISSDVRGIAFKTIAHIVNSCKLIFLTQTAAASEGIQLELYTIVGHVWTLLDKHHVRAAQTINLTASSSAVWKGVRDDLEYVESRNRKYPSTDGFLILVESLLAVAKYASPSLSAPVSDKLGVGAAERVAVYLEFIIDDVLMRASSREYYPQGSTGLSQRYKLTYRCFRVLVVILQQYQFLALSVTKLNNDWISNAGFVVMSLLLGKHRLLEQVLRVLSECDAKSVEASFHQRGHEVAMDCLQVLKDTVARHQKIAISFSPNQPLASDVESRQISGSIVHPDPDLSLYCIAQTSGDCAYWQEMVACSAVGLLYECMTAEETFMRQFQEQKMSRQTSMTSSSGVGGKRNRYEMLDGVSILLSEHGRPVVRPVLAMKLADILCSFDNLVKISNSMSPAWLSFNFRGCSADMSLVKSIPDIGVMSIALLQHVSVNASPASVISILLGSDQQQIRLMQHCVSVLREREVDVAHGCIDALTELHGRMQPLNVTCRVDQYSKYPITSDYEPDVLSMQGAVLRLLQVSLHSAGSVIGLGHYLLGYGSAWSNSSGAVSLLKQFRSPISCLDAVLQLVTQGNIIEFMIQNENQACACYDILQQLISNPTHASAVLKYMQNRVFPLGSHSVSSAHVASHCNFMLHQLITVRDFLVYNPILTAATGNAICKCTGSLFQMIAFQLKCFIGSESSMTTDNSILSTESLAIETSALIETYLKLGLDICARTSSDTPLIRSAQLRKLAEKYTIYLLPNSYAQNRFYRVNIHNFKNAASHQLFQFQHQQHILSQQQHSALNPFSHKYIGTSSKGIASNPDIVLDFSSDDLENAVAELTNFNLHQQLLNSSLNMLGASSYLTTLLSALLAPAVTRKNQEIEVCFRAVLDNLVMPGLTLLLSFASTVQSVNLSSLAREEVAVAILSAVNTLLQLSQLNLSTTETSNSLTKLSLDEYRQLLTLSMRLLRAMNLLGTTPAYRSNLQIIATRLLQYSLVKGLLKERVLSHEIPLQASEETKFDISIQQTYEDMMKINMVVLSPVIDDIVEVLFRDILTESIELKLTALALLNELLAVFNTSQFLTLPNMTGLSESTLAAMNTNKNNFSVLLTYIIVPVAFSGIDQSVELDVIDEKTSEQLELISSVLTCCTHLASIPSGKGTELLTSGGIIERLLQLSALFNYANNYGKVSDMIEDKDLVITLCRQIMELLVCLGTVSFNLTVSEGIAAFLTRNHVFITGVLSSTSKPFPSDQQLNWIELAVCLLKLVAASPDNQQRQLSRTNLDVSYSSISFDTKISISPETLDSDLKELGDVYTRNANKLLLTCMKLYTALSDREEERFKVNTCLSIVEHLAVYFRLRSATILNQVQSLGVMSSLQIIDFSVVLQTFVWSANESKIQQRLLFAAENLLWCIVSFVLGCDISVLSQHATLLGKALSTAESFPSDSFIRQVARWLRDHTY